MEWLTVAIPTSEHDSFCNSSYTGHCICTALMLVRLDERRVFLRQLVAYREDTTRKICVFHLPDDKEFNCVMCMTGSILDRLIASFSTERSSKFDGNI